MTKVNGLSLCALVLALAVTAHPATAHGTGANACRVGSEHERLLGDTMRSYFEWYYQPDQHPQETRWLYFVPLPDGTPVGEDPTIFKGQQSFSVSFGKLLVLPLATWTGESYTPDSGISDDTPDWPDKSWFTDSDVRLTVDGRAVVDSSRRSLDCVYFDAVWFMDPIVYDEPTDYASDAALWVKGLGVVLPPLPPGKHDIRLQIVLPDLEGVGHFGYDNRWRVTVQAPKKRH